LPGEKEKIDLEGRNIISLVQAMMMLSKYISIP